jgi:hypothetical protein
MTLREAMKILELNERTLEISMVESAAKERMRLAVSSTEQDQILEAYRRVQIFLDPRADERFLMRGSNVLVALSDTQDQLPASNQDEFLANNQDKSPENSHESIAPDLSATLFATPSEASIPENSTPIASVAPAIAPEAIANADLWLDQAPEALMTAEVNTSLADAATSSPVEAAFDSAEAELDFDVEMNFEALEDEQALSALVSDPEPVVAFQAAPLEDTGSESQVVMAPQAPVLDEVPVPVLDEVPVLDDPQPALAVATSQPLEHSAIDPTKTLEYPPEFDDALLKPRTVPQDSAALTVIEDSPRATRAKHRPPPKPATSSDRRVSRAAQASGVKKIYEKNRAKTTQSPPLWAWVLAAALLVGTGIFAAPALLRQFGTPASRPQTQNTLSVPTLPNAPKPSTPSATKPATPNTTKPVTKPKPQTVVQAKPKPSSSQVVQPVAKPVAKPAVKPTPVVKPTTPAPKPVVVAAPKPQTPATNTPKPTPKPQPAKPKPPVVDAQSAANLPPITAAKPIPKPTPKPVVKPAVKPAPKPVVKPAPKPAPKPVAAVPEPKPEPTAAVAPAAQPSPPAETLDPNNLTREQIGRRFLNEKYFEAWVTREAKLRYPSWADVPLAIQVLSLTDFQKAVLISF